MVKQLFLVLALFTCIGCADIRSLPNVYVIDRDDAKALMSRYDEPGDKIAVRNGADGKSVVVQYQYDDHMSSNYMLFQRGQSEPTIYHDVSNVESLPDLWLPRGQHSRDWQGEPSLNYTDQTASVSVVNYYDREPRVTEVIDREQDDRVITSFESIGCPSVYVRSDLIVLVTYDYAEGQEVITLDRSTGRTVNRWMLPWTAEYSAGRMDLTGEYLILIARPIPVTPTLVLFNTSTGERRPLKVPRPDEKCSVFLSDRWFVDLLDEVR